MFFTVSLTFKNVVFLRHFEFSKVVDLCCFRCDNHTYEQISPSCGHCGCPSFFLLRNPGFIPSAACPGTPIAECCMHWHQLQSAACPGTPIAECCMHCHTNCRVLHALAHQLQSATCTGTPIAECCMHWHTNCRVLHALAYQLQSILQATISFPDVRFRFYAVVVTSPPSQVSFCSSRIRKT